MISNLILRYIILGYLNIYLIKYIFDLGKCVARTQFIVDFKSIRFLHKKYCKNIIFL